MTNGGLSIISNIEASKRNQTADMVWCHGSSGHEMILVIKISAREQRVELIFSAHYTGILYTAGAEGLHQLLSHPMLW